MAKQQGKRFKMNKNLKRFLKDVVMDAQEYNGFIEITTDYSLLLAQEIRRLSGGKVRDIIDGKGWLMMRVGGYKKQAIITAEIRRALIGFKKLDGEIKAISKEAKIRK